MTIGQTVQAALDGELSSYRDDDPKALRRTFPEKQLRSMIAAAISRGMEELYAEVKRWHDSLSDGAKPERVQLQHVMRLIEERLRS